MEKLDSLKIYGVTVVGQKGQIILPLECREDYGIKKENTFKVGVMRDIAFGLYNNENCFTKDKKFFTYKSEIKIGSKFQFVIPSEIRNFLEIEKGNSVIVVGKKGHGIGFMKNDKINYLFEYIKENFNI